MVRAELLVLALAGCGRVGFDPPEGDGAPGGSARPCAFDLCEDFEAAAIDPSLWTIDPGVTRDTSVARRGNASARMHIDAIAPNQMAAAMLGESRTFATSRDLWVRGWFRLSALPVAGSEIEVIGLAQAANAAAANRVFVGPEQVGFDVLFGGISAGTNVNLPEVTWFCLLWHARLATSGGAMHLEGDLFDGGDLTGGQTDTTPPIGVLRFGIRAAPAQNSAQQPPLDLWLDDVIVHSAPLTCAD